MDGMRDAARLLPRPMDMREAEGARLVQRLWAGRYAARHTDPAVSPEMMALGQGCLAGGFIHRCLRPAFQRRTAGLGQPVDSPVRAFEPAIHIVKHDRAG